MSKKFYYCIFALVILIVMLILLPSRSGYWTDNDEPCWSEDQCECGASGYVYTLSLGFVEIPYAFESCMPTKIRLEKEKKQRQQAEQARQERLQKLYNSNVCDEGWIPVDKHCESCNAPEVLKASESDCLKCNKYEQIRIYDPQSGECRLKI